MKKYSKEESKYLLDHRFVDSTKVIAENVSRIFGNNRAHWSVSQKLARLGVEKPRIGGFTPKETALIETFIGNPDINEMVTAMSNEFGYHYHSRASLITKRSRLKSERKSRKQSSVDIISCRDVITVPEPIKRGIFKPAVISTLKLVQAMSNAGYSARSLSSVPDIDLREEQILDMLTRTGVSKEYVPRIRAALDIKNW